MADQMISAKYGNIQGRARVQDFLFAPRARSSQSKVEAVLDNVHELQPTH
jgi:hypothetical protein